MSLIRHTSLNFIGVLIPMIVTLITVPIYIGYIGAERFGLLAIIWVILNYFSFFDLGLGRAVTQRIAFLSADGATDCSNVLWTSILSTLLLGMFGGVLLFLSADYIFSNYVKMSPVARDELEATVVWMLFSLPVLLPSTVMQGALQARLHFGATNGIHLICNTLGVLFPLLIAKLGYVELWFLVPAVLLSRVVMASLLFAQCWQREMLIGFPKIDSCELKSLLQYGGWVSIISILSPLLVTIDKLIISSISGVQSVAFYTIPYDLVSRTMIISGSFASALFPRLAASSHEDSFDLAIKSTESLVAVITPIVVLGLFLAHPFIQFWMGASFAEACFGVAELILVGVWINSLVIPHHSRLMASGKPKIVVMIYLIQLPIYLILLWFGIHIFGVAGAAAAWSFRVLLDTCMLLYASKALIRTLWSVWLHLLVVLGASIAVFFVNISAELDFLICVVLVLLSIFKSRSLLIAIFLKFFSKSAAA